MFINHILIDLLRLLKTITLPKKKKKENKYGKDVFFSDA